MFCSQCGTQVDATMAFCPKCGNKLSAPVQPAEQAPAQQAPAQPSANHHLFFATEGVTWANYHLVARDSAGNIRYDAKTVTESMVRYNARIYDPAGNELMGIHQQSKMTFSAMNFDLVVNGQVVSEVLQKAKMSKYVYELPQLGMYADGDFLSLNFTVCRNDGTPVATVSKKVTMWGDGYDIEYADPNLELVLLGTVMVIQMVLAAHRARRRRR